MKDPERIDRILKLLHTAWSENPELRLGQLIHNTTLIDYDLFYLDDLKLEYCLKQYLEHLKSEKSL